jgi:hypothetical protein
MGFETVCENAVESEIIIRLGCCHSELGQPYKLWDFNDPVSRMRCIKSNESDTNLTNELEGAAVACLKELFQHMPGGTEESRDKPQHCLHYD